MRSTPSGKRGRHLESANTGHLPGRVSDEWCATRGHARPGGFGQTCLVFGEDERRAIPARLHHRGSPGEGSVSTVHICSPQPVEIIGDRRTLSAPWFLGECSPGEHQPSCKRCAAFVRITSRTFECRIYEESTCGFYDGWYVVGEHYQCKRCGFESLPEREPEAAPDAICEEFGQ